VKNLEGTTKNLLKITGILFAGYVLVNVLPDIRRYTRIMMMWRLSFAPVSLITL
jgi:hypothetical protein